MTNQEFSNGFQTLVNSYQRFRDFDNKEPKDTIEFDEYEKSLYLTKAQEEYVLSLYNGKNPYGESYEKTEELRRYLSNIVRDAELPPIETSNGRPLGLESNSKFFTLPDDLWFIVYERALAAGEECDTKANQEVYPARHDEYNRLRKNPFRGANNRRALRLDLSDNVVEILSKLGITSYYIRYIRKVNPIILEDLPNGLEIGGKSNFSECELHESLHHKILELAVRMALQSKGYNLENNNENR